MDQDRFDDLTRRLAAGASRRQVLKTLTLGVVGGLFGLTGARRAGAQEDEKDAERCAEKAAELAAECTVLDDEKEAERCAERRVELCEECPETCAGCRSEGHPCESSTECCPGLVCEVRGPGAATRCVPPQPV